MVMASPVSAAVTSAMAVASIMSVEVGSPVVIISIIGIIIGFIIIPVVVDAHIGPGAAGEQGEEERRSAEESHSFHGSSLVHIPQSAREAKTPCALWEKSRP